MSTAPTEQPKTILSVAEVAAALGVDPDFPEDELLAYALGATSYINQKTGYFTWANDDPVNPLAKLCARLWVQHQHFQQDGYDREHDFALGISSLITDLQDIARSRKEEGDA